MQSLYGHYAKYGKVLFTGDCYMSITRMLLNLSYCVILLNYANFVFHRLVLYMVSNLVLLQNKL